MKLLKRVIPFVFLLAVLLSVFSGCGKKGKTITIWTSAESYRIDYYLSELKKKFPDYDIQMEYMNSSTIAAKILEEKENTTCDIILSEEYGYLQKCEEYLLELKDFDYSGFLPELVPASHKYTPELKNGGCIIINLDKIEEDQLPVPASYADLLDPVYKGKISMPSPASSGTGYMFLRQLTNEWGEDEAFDYFEKLTENMLHYTSSGSGPVNDLKMGEVAIGLGMTSQAVTEINENANLKILFFEEGSPYSVYGSGVLAKSAEKEGVMDVFNYLATDLCKDNNEMYFPDQIYKDFAPEVKNFPTNIKYGNMANDTMSEKERLLKKWTFG